MTNEMRTKCQFIIHGHAVACGAGNAIPVPGLGIAADIGTMTSMACALSAIFGKDINENVCKGLAVTALKRTVLKGPMKVFAKELSKLIPGLGQIVGPTVSAALIEAAGWELIREMDSRTLLE